jgi:hypothetical protein
LRESELVLLQEGEERAADRRHLETCLRCAARYRRVGDDLRVISRILESDPAPVAVPGRVVWPRWVAAAAATAVLVVGLNLLFAHEWSRVTTPRSDGPATVEGITTEELVAAVDAVSIDDPLPMLESPETSGLDQQSASTVAARVAELYAVLAGDEACESPAPLAEDECGRMPALAEALAAEFGDLES